MASKKKKTKTKRRSTTKRTRRRAMMRIPVAPLIGAMPIALSTINAGRVNPTLAGIVFVRNMTGVDIQNRRFDARFMYSGLVPIVAGLLIHRFIGGSLGFNRVMGRARLPFGI